MRDLDEEVIGWNGYTVTSSPVPEVYNGKYQPPVTGFCSGSIAVPTLHGSCEQVGQKFDTGKPPMELLSPIAMEGTAKVLGFGAKKYAANNWKNGIAWTRIIGAIMRHLAAIMRGEDIDKESGLPHVDHLGCEIMFLQEFYHTRKDLDDRYTTINKEK